MKCILCPVAAILNYMAVHPRIDSPLLVHDGSSLLTRDQFVRLVKKALYCANVNDTGYSSHSFSIGAETVAAAAGVPTHFIKMLGHWESSAYQVYLRTLRESLASTFPVDCRVRLCAAPWRWITDTGPQLCICTLIFVLYLDVSGITLGFILS